MALRVDSVNMNEVTTDPASPENGDVWLNSAAGVIRARVGGLTKAVNSKTLELSFWSELSPWIEIASISPVVVARFVFHGSDFMGPICAIMALIENDSGATTQVGIYDLTNANQICQASSAANVPTILDLGTPSNVPTGESIFEVQVARTAGLGGNKAKIGSLSVCF